MPVCGVPTGGEQGRGRRDHSGKGCWMRRLIREHNMASVRGWQLVVCFVLIGRVPDAGTCSCPQNAVPQQGRRRRPQDGRRAAALWLADCRSLLECRISFLKSFSLCNRGQAGRGIGRAVERQRCQAGLPQQAQPAGRSGCTDRTGSIKHCCCLRPCSKPRASLPGSSSLNVCLAPCSGLGELSSSELCKTCVGQSFAVL